MKNEHRVIPIFWIFDYQKAIEFYVDWLGFKIDWEHRFHDSSPLYMAVSRDHIALHLSEHHGDACPGSKAFIEFDHLKEYHKQLVDKKYKYNAPDWKRLPGMHCVWK